MLDARCPWYLAGPLIGLAIVGLRAAVNRPFGALGGYVDLVTHAASPRDLGIPAFITFGTLLGGLLFALASGTFAPAFSYDVGLMSATPPAEWAALLAAGVAMGFGARTAGGCTSGHGLCGMSLGSPASLAATITFFTTAVLITNAIAWVGGGR